MSLVTKVYCLTAITVHNTSGYPASASLQRKWQKEFLANACKNLLGVIGYPRAQDKVHNVFSHRTTGNRCKTNRKPHTTFSREHPAVKTEMKIKTKWIPSKQLSIKKPHDMVRTAEWQFYNIEVFCNYSCGRVQAKSLADIDAYMSIIYKFPLKS